tara:strand:+ start:1437 stop:1913 length:477 start_codon:yes stop_codon:yes gene_type:complete
MKDIMVVDNFFNEKELNILVNNLDKINYESDQNESGNYGFGHKFNPDETNQWLFDKIKNVFLKEKDLKPLSSAIRMRHNSKKVLPHIDNESKYNFLCYLKGKELMYNGTGFYNDKKDLDRYIGFKENRAMFFDSHIYHTDLQALGESSPRYTLGIFYG